MKEKTIARNREMYEKYRAGESLCSLAEEYKINTQTVRRILSPFIEDCIRRDNSREKINEARHLIMTGYSDDEIAEMTGMSKQWVRYAKSTQKKGDDLTVMMTKTEIQSFAESTRLGEVFTLPVLKEELNSKGNHVMKMSLIKAVLLGKYPHLAETSAGTYRWSDLYLSKLRQERCFIEAAN